MNQHPLFTHAPLRVILSRCLSNKWSSPSNVEVSSNRCLQTYHHSPFDTKIIDPRCCLRIHDLVPRLLPTKSDDRPFECARILLQVAFYDHPMSLRMSLLHPTNRVTYQLMVWISLF